MTKNAWAVFIALLAVLITVVIWLRLDSQLSLTNSQRAVFKAAVLGIAICGITRVLLRCGPGNHSDNANSSSDLSNPANTQTGQRSDDK